MRKEQKRVKLSEQNGAEQSRAQLQRTGFVSRAEHSSREQRGGDESKEEQRKAEKSKGKESRTEQSRAQHERAKHSSRAGHRHSRRDESGSAAQQQTRAQQ